MDTMRWVRVGCVAVGVAWASPGWSGELVAHVEAVDFKATGNVVTDVKTALSRVHAFYEDALGLDLPAVVDVRVRLVADRGTYDQMARAEGHTEPTLGFFSRQSGGVVWNAPDAAQMRGTLVHEASHFLLSEAGRRPPRWLNEGLAEVVERHRVQGNAVWLDPDARMLAWLRSTPDLPSLATLVGAPSDTWAALGTTPIGEADRGLGWSVCAFLLSSRQGKALLARWLAATDDGELPAMVEEVYGGGLTQLDRDWRAWWRSSPRPVSLPLRTGTFEAPPETPGCEDGILIRRGDAVVCSR